MILAIDGPAASGKGTLARRLAEHYGLPHLDTGLLYRAVAQQLLDAGLPLSDEEHAVAAARSLDLSGLHDMRLRGRAMGEAASVVGAMSEVRMALLELQRAFADQPGGAVLDGRDIGTVICPHAEVKLFVTASAPERARRRARELAARGEPADEVAILADIRRRDERDANRAVAPLLPAPDAHILDTSHMSIDEVFAAARAVVESFRSKGAYTSA